MKTSALALTLLFALACSSEPATGRLSEQNVSGSTSISGAPANGSGGSSAGPNSGGGARTLKTGGASSLPGSGGAGNTLAGGGPASGGATYLTGGTSTSGGTNATGGMNVGAGTNTGGANGQSVSGDPGAVLNGQRWETAANAPQDAQGSCIHTDKTVQFGGTPGAIYNVTLRFRGVLEAKEYAGGSVQGDPVANSPGCDLPAPGHDSLQFYTGGVGAPDSHWSAYNVVGFTVSAPMQSYYLNGVMSCTPDDTVFPIDYMATIQIAGGATVHLTQTDPNCSIIPNATDFVLPGMTAPIRVPGVASNSTGEAGQFAQMDVVSVTQ